MYSHTGYKRQIGHVHTGRLYGHSDYRGKQHALNGCSNIYDGALYRALCGETVRADHDGYSFNVSPGAGVVTCKRCQRKLCT